MPEALKPFKTYDQQIEILKLRGLVVNDEALALQKLSTLNYYRLSGYTFLRMDRQTNKFLPKVTFEHILRLYEFDEKLRNILFQALEHIEIAARTRIAYHFSMAHQSPNNDSHYCVKYFSDLEKHEGIFDKKLKDLIEKNCSIPFVKRHLCTYNGRMPLWAAVELLSFSCVSVLYSIMLTDDKKEIARCFDCSADYLENWLHVLSVLRNRCAHFGRLYANLITPPINLGLAFKKANPAVAVTSLFAVVTVVNYLQPQEEYRVSFQTGLRAVIEEYSDVIDLKELTFPKNWATVLRTNKMQ